MKVITQEGQSLFDISIIFLGDAMQAYDIAKANGKDVTAELPAGTELIIPESIEANKQIVDYYASKRLNPATRAETPELDRVFGEEMPEQFS